MTGTGDGSTELDEVLRRVYSAPLEDFVKVRSELVVRARDEGDRAFAKKVGALRKPTSAASIVNRHVLDDSSVTGRLIDMGDRLRAAQNSPDGIDRDLLRELSLERRALVGDVSAQALEAFGPTSGQPVRDEVVATFDAAVADPDVAACLGRLTRAQLWSGFGAVADGPALTVVPGGRSKTGSGSTSGTKQPATKKPGTASGAKPSTKPTGSARRERELAAARDTLSFAERELSAALDHEHAVSERISGIEARMSELQTELDATGRDAKDARSAVRAARSKHREARSARDRAERRGQS